MVVYNPTSFCVEELCAAKIATREWAFQMVTWITASSQIGVHWNASRYTEDCGDHRLLICTVCMDTIVERGACKKSEEDNDQNVENAQGSVKHGAVVLAGSLKTRPQGSGCAYYLKYVYLSIARS